jgi:hypothetical protein
MLTNRPTPCIDNLILGRSTILLTQIEANEFQIESNHVGL